MSGLTDGQVVGGIVFVIVPALVLGYALLEGRVRSRRAAREVARAASTRAHGELTVRRDEARTRRRERVLTQNTTHPHPYRARLAAQKLREFGERGLLEGGSVTWAGPATDEWLAGEPEHPDDPYL